MAGKVRALHDHPCAQAVRCKVGGRRQRSARLARNTVKRRYFKDFPSVEATTPRRAWELQPLDINVRLGFRLEVERLVRERQSLIR